MSAFEDPAATWSRRTGDKPAGTAALVGRDNEIKVLERFISRLAADGGALLLHGEAGVGKTALLDAAEQKVLLQGHQVIRTVGIEFEAEEAYAGLLRVLTPALSSLSELNPAHQRILSTALGLDGGPPPERLAVSTAALSLLSHGRGDAPMLIIVDDLPWLDRVSAAVLAFVARRLAGSHIGFLGASRTGEASYFDFSGIDTLEVTALDPASAAGLIDSRYPRLAPRARQELLDQAAGNPLALLELPASTQNQQHPAFNAPHAVTPMTDRLQNLFAARVKALPDSARRVLLLAALDATGDWSVLAGASGMREPLDELATAEQAHLIRVDRGMRRVNFRHPLTRSAVVAMAGPQARRQAHTELAAQLQHQPDRYAWHLAEAATEPDERVAELLERAAERVQRRGDAVGAVAALLRSADLTPHERDRTRRLALAAYVGAEITGDVSHVPELLATVQPGASQGAAPLTLAVAASAYLLNGEGDVNAAHRVLLGAIENRNNHDFGDPALEEALWYLIAICAFSGRAKPWDALNAMVAQFRPEPPRYLTVIAKTFGNPAHEALPVLGELDDMLAQLSHESDPAHVARVGIASAYVDRLVACRGPLQRVLDHGRDGGAVTSQLQVAVLVGEDYFFGGQWDEVVENCEEAVRVGRSHGYPLLTWTMMHQRALVDAARGNSGPAREVIDGMTGWAAPRGVDLLVQYAHGIELLLALGQEDYQKAWENACRLTSPGELAHYVPYVLWSLLDYLEAGVRANRSAEVARHVATLRRMNIPAISPRLAMVTAAAEGMVATNDTFADAFDAALAVPEATRWPFELARIQLFYGERLRHARATVEARRHLNAALDTFQRLDARPWTTRAGNELRATGRVPSKRPTADLTKLTPQQREIALLAAAGLTNKQIAERLFLSPRTVGTHLYQIFPKLGVVSRAGLRDALNDQSP
ncbi:AAA family ATPase [Actinoplanes sp. NPDC000266]